MLDVAINFVLVRGRHKRKRKTPCKTLDSLSPSSDVKNIQSKFQRTYRIQEKMQLLRNFRRSSLTNHFNTRFCTSFANFSSSSTYSAPSDPFLPPNQMASKSRFLCFIKFAAVGAVTAALGTSAYATYAYTADEVDEKTKGFRSSISHPMELTAETFPHMVYSTAMTVPSKAIDLYLELRRLAEGHIQEIAEPNADKLLPDMEKVEEQNRAFTLVLDLNETLILSEWKRERGWSTFKRPGLDDFLAHLAQIYEIVVYSDAMVDENIQIKLMEKGVRYVLSRAATKYQDGKHFRDLSKLNRDPSRVLYVSGHALESCLQPENCVPIKPWKKEADDTTLIDLIPFLEYVGLHRPADIRPVLASYDGKDIPSEFISRSREYQRQLGNKKKLKAFSWSRNNVQ